MLTYSFADLGSDSLYEHLYKCIKKDILDGNLKGGEKLPSKRSFAKNLGISVITVENAYECLISEGYIYSVPKKGFYVKTFKRENLPLSLEVASENTYLTGEKEPYFVDFSSNQTLSEYFPFSVWAKLIREHLSSRQHELMTNTPCGGLPELRMAIAKHLKDFRGMKVAPEQIIVGAGTEYLYGLLIQLLGFEKKYALEDPGYRKIFQIYESHKVDCVFVGMDENGVIVEEAERQNVDIIHISPSHHFPTGIVMPIARRYELLSWASRLEKRYIIEDDYDSEFRLSGQPIPTLQSIDVAEKVIYMNTFTKTLASTVRISYMVLPKHLTERYYKKLSFYSCTVSNFDQYTLAEFISGGYFEKHLNRLRNFYRNKRNLILKAIKGSPLSKYVTILKEDAGLHFLLKINVPFSREIFERKLKENGIKLLSISVYCEKPSEDTSSMFIINYSSLLEERTEKAVSIIYECLKASQKRRSIRETLINSPKQIRR